MIDDAQLIAQAQAGDSAAFGQLVTKYQDRLFNTVAHMLGCRETAADIVQDAFVQAYVKLNTYRGASAFYTWLYRISANLAHTRRRRERPVASIDAARDVLGHEPHDDLPPPEARLEQQEQAAQVQRALASLSAEHREILILRDVEDHSYEEIAEMLDLPLGTIRSRLHRARLQLRDQLHRLWHETPPELTQPRSETTRTNV